MRAPSARQNPEANNPGDGDARLDWKTEANRSASRLPRDIGWMV